MARDRFIDIFKGIGVLSVIVGHTTHIWSLRGLITSFLMPLFFFASGWCHKPVKTLQLMKKMLGSLIVPYLILNLLQLVLILITNSFSWGGVEVGMILKKIAFANGDVSEAPIWGKMSSVGILWFLPALFWARLIFNLLCNESNSFLYSVIISVSSTLLGRYVINLPFGILLGGQSVVFVAFGYWIKQKWNSGLNPMFFILLLIGWACHFFVGGFSLSGFYYGCYPLNIVGACCACYLIFFGVRKIVDLRFLTHMNSFLEFCGLTSLIIYGVHAISLPYLQFESHYITTLVNVCLCVVMSWFYSIVKNRLYSSMSK